MGLFEWFKKRPHSIPLPQLCYDVGYFILPHYADHDVAKVADLCLKSPSVAGPFFYVMACQVRKVEPVIEDAKRFTWHHGKLRHGREYFVLEYPVPPPVDMSHMAVEEMLSEANPLVLAPYFSAILRDDGGATAYYILGQAPIGGGTTLRRVSKHVNSNLGPGPAPNLAAFLGALEE